MKMRSAQVVLLIILLSSNACHSKEASEWNNSLHAALKDATRLRVRTKGTCHRQIENEKTLFEISDKDAIAELVRHIEIKESGFQCMCCGDPTMEFYRGSELVASVGLHHGQSIRWPEGNWPGDGMLTWKSRIYLFSWMDAHGVTEPKQEYEKNQRKAKEREESRKTWFRAMPSSLKPFQDKMMDPFKGMDAKDMAEMNDALAKQFPKQEERILALLGWFGSGMGPWSGFPAYEAVAEDLLISYETKEILDAIEGKQLTQQQIEGTARLFGGWHFSRKHPDDSKLLPTELKRRLLEHSLKSQDGDKRTRAQKAFGEQSDSNNSSSPT